MTEQAKPTEGEWLAAPDENCGGGANVFVMRQTAPNVLSGIVLAHTHAVRAPNVLRGTPVIETPEAMANARVMAAAKDMAAALAVLTALCEERGLYPINTDEARDALRKAGWPMPQSSEDPS